MAKIQEILANNVSRIRNTLGFTQGQLAELVGVGLKQIQRIEYQETWISPETLESIASALQVQVYELLADSNASVQRSFYNSQYLEDLKKAFDGLNSAFTQARHQLTGLPKIHSELVSLLADMTPEKQQRLADEIRAGRGERPSASTARKARK